MAYRSNFDEPPWQGPGPSPWGTFYVFEMAVRASKGIAWRSKHESPETVDNLCVIKTFISWKLQGRFTIETWMNEWPNSFIEPVVKLGCHRRTVERILAFADEMAPLLGYSDADRREKLIAWCRAQRQDPSVNWPYDEDEM